MLEENNEQVTQTKKQNEILKLELTSCSDSDLLQLVTYYYFELIVCK